MTTATTEAPAAPPTLTPVEWVKTLPVEAREAILMELLKELIEVRGGRGRVDIATNETDYIGYFVSAEAERRDAERWMPEHDPAWEAELDRRSREGPHIPAQQMIAELRAEAARLGASHGTQ